MKTKVCALLLTLGTLMILPWFALSMTSDNDVIGGKGCAGILGWL